MEDPKTRLISKRLSGGRNVNNELGAAGAVESDTVVGWVGNMDPAGGSAGWIKDPAGGATRGARAASAKGKDVAGAGASPAAP